MPARATVEPPKLPRYAFGTEDEEILGAHISRSDDELTLSEHTTNSCPYLDAWGGMKLGETMDMIFGDREKDEWFTCSAFSRYCRSGVTTTLTVVISHLEPTDRPLNWR